uniref:Coiled-coil domain-containing protein 33 n=1 Tax=Callorhinchus milii TaxID=7868 RepID=A0A4W3HK35_CALMI|eukprot:gi/632938754/ref/XP_007906253.1/ PREDICTED: coiled-coil domain-containing protein 33 isoform X1 [Callorhinchus milii]
MFHHYHVELMQPHVNVPSGVRLYATLVRKGSVIPRQEGFAFTGFEVLVRGLERPLKDPVGPLLVVARIVPNCESYKDAMLMKTSRLAGITVTTVKYPNPPRSSFEVFDCTNHGYPQVSAAGYPQEQPNWNHSFLFQGRDCATAFTTGAALVLEYYSITTVMNSVNWHIRCPLGFSVVPLNQDIYHKLMAEHGSHGMRVDDLPVQGTSLQTVFNTRPTVGLILRLIGSERPDSILTMLDPLRFPAMDWETLHCPLDENQQQAPSAHLSPVNPVTSLEIGSSKEIPQSQTLDKTAESPPAPAVARPPVVKLQQDQGRLPPYDALAQILPEYNYLFSATHLSSKQPRPQQPTSKAPYPLPIQQPALTSEERGPLTGERIANREFTDHEAKEMDNYRTAMRKMAEDIIDLRKNISSLEAENSKLRSELSLHQDLGRTLLEDTDIDVMTKAEIADRIVSLKQKLAGESVELQSYKVKVQQLQNELIRKNDREKELIWLQKAHQQQQAVLQKYQEKGSQLKLLEDTIRQQEKVIEKMERLLDKKLREKPREKPGALKTPTAIIDDSSTQKEVELVLLAENARLREELQKLRHEPNPIILQQPFHPVPDSFSDSEKLCLLAKLEKAQGCIRTLEAVMEENSRKWGQEKQNLLTRLSESEHGFARTSTMVLHDFPMKNVSDSVLT